MIWAILALLGVPLWLCALAITVLVLRNRALRTRGGDLPVRLLLPGKKHWVRGHALWAHDVLAFRGSPAAWREHLWWVDRAAVEEPDELVRKKLRHLGDGFVLVSLHDHDGSTTQVAATADHAAGLLGPFETTRGVAAG